MGAIRLVVSHGQVLRWRQRSNRIKYPAVISIRCPHCSAHVVVDSENINDLSSPPCVVFDALCPACQNRPIFFIPASKLDDWQQPTIYIHPRPQNSRILQAISGDALPEGIRKSYDEMIAVFEAGHWIASAAMCRRTLEGIVRDLLEGDATNHLASDINKLSQDIKAGGKIAESVTQPADAVRIGGNFAVHFNADHRPDREIASTMVDFVIFLLEFIYIMPNNASILVEKIKNVEDQDLASEPNNASCETPSDVSVE